MPSITLIHPTVLPQYTNVTDRTDGQQSDSIGQTVLETVAQKPTGYRYRWQLGLVVACWSWSSYSMPGSVSTGMGDHLRVGKPPRFVTSHSGQLSLLPSVGRKMSIGQSEMTLCGWEYGSFHLWINVWVAGKTVCHPSLTRAIPERFRDEFLMIKCWKTTVPFL